MIAPQNSSPLRILVVDDLPSIHDDFRKILQPVAPAQAILDKASLIFGTSASTPQAPRFQVDSAFQGQEGLALLNKALDENRPYALAFVDMRMPPGWDGLETVRHLWKADKRLQIVICTAHSDYTWADFNTALGTCDNLIILKKPFDNIEVQQLSHALTSKWLLARELAAHIESLDELVRQRTAQLSSANEELRASDQRFRLTLAAAQQGLYDLNVTTSEIRTTPEYARILGYPPDHFVESFEAWLSRMPDEDRLRVEAEYNEYLHGSSDTSFFSLEYRQVTAAGSTLWILMRGNVVNRDPQGRPLRILGTITDITERHIADLRLQRSQRLECIGSLASGIAHDINNALVPQLSGVSLLRPFVPPDKAELLDLMALSANRAAQMVVQLVHFARGADGQRLPVSPKCLVEEIERFIGGTFPKNICCHFQCSCPATILVGDPTQLHQILLNLCVNARDAMPEGGKLNVLLSRVDVDATMAQKIVGANIGPHVCMCVSDTGTGISESIRERIFDPFFTTKAPDKGTGLGLSTVLGITKGHGGFIDLQTERNKGSAFFIYLPVAANAASEVEELITAPPQTIAPNPDKNLILLVDDEAPIRSIAPFLFKDSPYRLSTAASGAEALLQLTAHQHDLALLVIDLSMADMDGIELIRRVRIAHPALCIMAMSGNFTKNSMEELRGLGLLHFLPKPFDRHTLFTKIYAALRA